VGSETFRIAYLFSEIISFDFSNSLDLVIIYCVFKCTVGKLITQHCNDFP
jgi:hypothetical protein